MLGHKRAVNRHQIFTVAALCGFLRQFVKLIHRDVAQPQSDFLRTGDAQTLTLFEYLHEMACFDKGRVGTSIEPGKTAAKNLDVQIPLFKISTIYIRDFEFASRGWV